MNKQENEIKRENAVNSSISKLLVSFLKSSQQKLKKIAKYEYSDYFSRNNFFPLTDATTVCSYPSQILKAQCLRFCYIE